VTEILDLDVFAPPARSVRFTDRAGKAHTFDVTFISFKVGLVILANMETFQALTQDASSVNEKSFQAIVNVISEIGIQTDADLTPEFLMANLSVTQGIKLLEAAMGPIVDFLGSNMSGAAGAEK
jgi:hypothetical protein